MAGSDGSPTPTMMFGRRSDDALQAKGPWTGISAGPQHQITGLPVREHLLEATASLARLRCAFTPLGWAIVYDGRSTWTALHSRVGEFCAHTPVELDSAIETAAARATGPRGQL